MTDADNTQSADPSSLGHMPDELWEFDESVTAVFTDMLRRSIPQYEVMRQAVRDIGMQFARPGTDIVDLGCSRGDALVPFVESLGAQCTYVGVEVSPPMISASRRRFRSHIDAGTVRILDLDLRTDYPSVTASVTLCILTLQFTPVDQRSRILAEVYAHSAPGGVLILVEKLLGATPEIDSLMIDIYHALKMTHGYTREEVERKRMALEGVLVPLSARQDEDLMRDAGFQQVDCFWRWMNFAGWIAWKTVRPTV